MPAEPNKTTPPSAFLTNAERAQIANQAAATATAAMRAEAKQTRVTDSEISGLDASISAAAGEGDAALVASLIRERDSLKTNSEVPTEAWYEGETFQNSIEAHAKAWSWYGVNVDATRKANEVGDMLDASKFNSEAEFFSHVEEAATKGASAPRADTEPRVAVPGASAVSTAPSLTEPTVDKPQAFKDLDKEQKGVFDMFVAQLSIDPEDEKGLAEAQQMFVENIGTYEEERP